MDNDSYRRVGFYAPPQHFDTPMEADETQACLLRQNWPETSPEHSVFGSSLSSLVSSPATETNPGDRFMITELIGKLSNFGNSFNDFLPSSSSSCYNTPLSSPAKLDFPAMYRTMTPSSSAAPEISAATRFPEWEARLPSSGIGGLKTTPSSSSRNASEDQPDRSIAATTPNKKTPRVEGTPPALIAVGSQQAPNGGNFSRKRKALTKGKVKESRVGDLRSTNPRKNGEVDANDPITKKSRSKDKKTKEKSCFKGEEEEKESKRNNEKPPEPEKDYIHVRARRGQATDSHSLAERVRREKISERMRFLQDLVPGCNKVTGKALMLDEIINYVQSLQRQVEFLSMKLSSVNTRNIIQENSSSQVLQYDHSTLLPISPPPPTPQRSHNAPRTFCEDDLHTIVQMGSGNTHKSHGKNIDNSSFQN